MTTETKKPGDTPSSAAVRLCVKFSLPASLCECVLEMFDGNERHAEIGLGLVVTGHKHDEVFQADVLARLAKLEAAAPPEEELDPTKPGGCR